MLVTEPTLTPRKWTGAPTCKPWIEPSKYMTHLMVSVSNLPEPRITTPAIASTTAPMMKPPMTAGLASFMCEELVYLWVWRLCQQLFRVALRNHRLGVRIEKYRVRANRQNTRQLMRH